MGWVVSSHGGLVFLRLAPPLSAGSSRWPRFASDLPATRFFRATPSMDDVHHAE
jgi:hypothetical protein